MPILPIVLALALPQTAAPAAVPAPAAPTGGPTLVCKRMVETGSLVRKRKICYTKGEWEKIAMAAQAGSQALQDSNMNRPLAEGR